MVEIAHVEGVARHLLPPDRVGPLAPLVGHSVQHLGKDVVGAVDDHGGGRKLVDHLGEERTPLVRHLGQDVAGESEELADLGELVLEHRPGEEDEHCVLEHLGLALGIVWVEKVLVIHWHVVHHAVAARRAEDHALEGGSHRAWHEAGDVLEHAVVRARGELVGHQRGKHTSRGRARRTTLGARHIHWGALARAGAARAQGPSVERAAHFHDDALLTQRVVVFPQRQELCRELLELALVL
mmetsp:Transcript_17360/g.53908  ORF Transcript_17360/g.53908 Transcript_17360/m.53908 type:complete len:240 (-) Transcript_17360:416-1135(-)